MYLGIYSTQVYLRSNKDTLYRNLGVDNFGILYKVNYLVYISMFERSNLETKN